MLKNLCRRETLTVTGEIIDVIFQTFDLLEKLVKDAIEGEDSVSAEEYEEAIKTIQAAAGPVKDQPETITDMSSIEEVVEEKPPKPEDKPEAAKAVEPEVKPAEVSKEVPAVEEKVPEDAATPSAPTEREVIEDNVNMEEMEQYMGMYCDGANEGIEEMNKLLLKLEKDQSDIGIFNDMFRSAHTLKGMSATMGFNRIAYVTHEMESLMDKCRNQEIELNPGIIDAIFETFDVLEKLVQESIDNESSDLDFYSVVDRLKALSCGDAVAAVKEAVPDKGPDLQMEYNEFERQVAIQALRQEYHCFMVYVRLIHDCLLKSARVYMVVRALEEQECEIIKCDPSSEELEEEKFDLDFRIVVVTRAEKQAIYDSVDSVSEIDKLDVTNLDETYFTGEAPQPQEKAPEPAAVTEVKSPEKKEKKATPEKTERKSTALVVKKAAAAPATKAAVKKPVAKKGGKKAIPTTIRVDMRRLEELMNLVGELVTNKTRLTEVVQNERIRLKPIKGAGDLKELTEVLERVNMITGSLQEVVLKVRMVPIETVFDRFPRLVRDLSKKLSKKINLVIEGKETEMDRTVIDEIGDPMVHLIRNSIDHGIEDPEIRKNEGKDETGTIVLNAHHEGNNVVIEIKDDGKGINPEVVGRLAVERGMYSEEEIAAMPVSDIQKLVFMAGFSTADSVSDLSGRGVGMDAVKAKIEELNGQLLVDSRVGEGTTIRVKLPMTLAILQALMINLQTETYAIPLSMVLETVDIYLEDINVVQHQEVYVLRGEVIPLIRLNKILDVPIIESDDSDVAREEESEGDDEEDTEVGEISIVVCSNGEKKAGFMVDNLIGQQEIVIKPLGQILMGLTGLMGATIKGDGSVALILDIPALMESK
ncbi:chemotaxis protein CheW [Candidatus Riflebacteria bacterium]